MTNPEPSGIDRSAGRAKPAPLDILRKHRYSLPESPKSFRPEVPAALNTLIVRLLSKLPDERPSSAREVIIALEQMQTSTALADFQVEAVEDLPLLERSFHVMVIRSTSFIL